MKGWFFQSDGGGGKTQVFVLGTSLYTLCLYHLIKFMLQPTPFCLPTYLNIASHINLINLLSGSIPTLSTLDFVAYG